MSNELDSYSYYCHQEAVNQIVHRTTRSLLTQITNQALFCSTSFQACFLTKYDIFLFGIFLPFELFMALKLWWRGKQLHARQVV